MPRPAEAFVGRYPARITRVGVLPQLAKRLVSLGFFYNQLARDEYLGEAPWDDSMLDRLRRFVSLTTTIQDLAVPQLLG